MKVNVAEQVKGYGDEPMFLDEKSEAPVTYRFLIMLAVNNQGPGEREWSPEDKITGFMISSKVQADEVDLDQDERAFIIKRSGMNNNALGHGRLKERLEDPKEDKAEEN